MKPGIVIQIFATCWLIFSLPSIIVAIESENLVKNGDFETPVPHDPSRPAHWEKTWGEDDPKCGWIEGGHSGKRCILVRKSNFGSGG